MLRRRIAKSDKFPKVSAEQSLLLRPAGLTIPPHSDLTIPTYWYYMRKTTH
jgi:hypothetical protein